MEAGKKRKMLATLAVAKLGLAIGVGRPRQILKNKGRINVHDCYLLLKTPPCLSQDSGGLLTWLRHCTLVGCNYAGTENELRGCINDVHGMRAVLLDRFGFAPGDVTVLTDEPGAATAGVLPIGAGVRRALADMVARAAPGDVLFFHFSGHGTLVPPVGGGYGGGRDDEAIVPCDFNLITDVDFRELVDRVPWGATFTMVSDSCNSGGLIDQEKEQIGPEAAAAADRDLRIHAVRRFLPYATVLGHLSGASGLSASSHHVAEHLVALFGADASAKFHSHRHAVHHGNSRGAARTDDADAGILLSGCQEDELSADVTGHGGKAFGAFSAALQAVLAAHPAPMSNREVVLRAREVLAEQGFEQHPCLYCSDANIDAPFLGQRETKPKSFFFLIKPKTKPKSY